MFQTIQEGLSMSDSILSKAKKRDFEELCILAYKIDNSIDISYLMYQYENKNPGLLELQERWYESLRNNNPDYSVYGESLYLNEAFVCWKDYSREYLKRIKKFLPNLDTINSVLDLGCGISFSTIGLSEVFPNAKVFGTNIRDTLQWEICQEMTKDIESIKIVDNNMSVDENIDLIFASEFFEHIDDPIDLLSKLIDKYLPKYFVFANTFSQPAIGHFNIYPYKGVLVDGKKMSRLFGQTLRDLGYYKLETGFYNNRPSIFKLLNGIDREEFKK